MDKDRRRREILSAVLALLREQWERVAQDPYLSRRAEEIRQHARILAPTWVADQVESYHKDRQSERDRRLLDKSRYFDGP